MKSTPLYIKNMVCNRCIKVVKESIEDAGYEVMSIKLGEVVITSDLEKSDYEKLRITLEGEGFELLDDRKQQIIEKIKNKIIELIHQKNDFKLKINISDWLAEEMGMEYTYLSTLFSSLEGVTIEKYLILQRIEKVKELLVYNQLSLKEIAWQLGYSSVAHLSNQFKKVTGLTPGHFKEIKEDKRKALDEVGVSAKEIRLD